MYSMKQVLTLMWIHLKMGLDYYYDQIEEKKEALAYLESRLVRIH
jgi:hypothetical protein